MAAQLPRRFSASSEREPGSAASVNIVSPWSAAMLGEFATDWAWSSMRFASTLPAYDPLRTSLFGTATLPWDMTQQATAGGDADPRDAAAALLAHVDRADGPLRLLIGDDAPVHVGTALEGRRDYYARDPRFAWPAP
jgi:hypothetical protein